MFQFFFNKNKSLEKARLTLIESLDKGDIDYLLKQMNNKEVYSPLLTRKQRKEISSTDYISWYAYRRAENLNLPEQKHRLMEKLNLTTDEVEKKHIYFCLAKYCKNMLDDSLFNFLMERLDVEEDNDCRITIMTGVAYMHKASNFNIAPLKKLVRTRNRDQQIHAIIALQQTNDSEVENLLLPLFIDTKDNHLKSVIAWTLESIGTARSIPVLEEAYERLGDQELKDYIGSAIEKIRGRI